MSAPEVPTAPATPDTETTPTAPESAAGGALGAAASEPASSAPAEAEVGLIEPVLVPPRGLVATILVALLACAAVAVVWAPPVGNALKPSLALDGWRGTLAEQDQMAARDQALLRTEQARRQQPARLERERAFRQGLAAWLALERQVGAAAVAQHVEARRALGQAEEHLRTLALADGADAVRAVAVEYGREVRAAVEGVVEAAAARGGSLAELWSAESLPAPAAALVDLAGGLGEALVAAGLEHHVRGGRLDPAVGLVVEALAAHRVYELGVRIPGGGPAPPQDSELLLLRFRIEGHGALGLARRLELLEALEATDPAYPAAYTRAVLLAREGQFDAARVWFERAADLGQNPRQARANARWLSRRQVVESAAEPAVESAP